MINKEFQELKGKLYNGCEEIISAMRENLKRRNDQNSEYKFGYTKQDVTYNIDTCGPMELLEIDGDMCPLGK